MKSKLSPVLILLFLVHTCLKAQFYGQNMYLSIAIPSMIVSSAKTTNIHSTGFIMGMYDANTISFTKPFYVNKTDMQGNYSSSNDFWTYYKLYKDNTNCSSPPQNVTPDNCYGISVIETGNLSTPANGSRYALAGACGGSLSDYFCVFATLDQSGNVVNKAYYDFPSTATGATKPVIAESVANPGYYYISGGYSDSNGQYAYIIYVDVNGTVQWSNYYDCGDQMYTTGIMESPYNSSELVLVGVTAPDINQVPGYNLATNGFFLKVSASNGAVILYKIYGEDSNSPVWAACNELYCLNIAKSTFGNSSGFIVGGYTDPTISNPGVKGAWVMKLSPNGNIIWNKIIGTSPGIAGIVQSVLERQNPYNGNFEYYASARDQYPTVYRLNNNGTMYGLGNNKYEYTGISGFWPVYLTDINNGGSPDDGIQVYSTDFITGNDQYFVKAYYNGVSGCQETLSMENQFAGPQDVYTHQLNVSSGPTNGSCISFDLFAVPYVSGSISNFCTATSIGSGSNAKATGIAENTNSQFGLSMIPNPTNGNFVLKLNSASNDNVKIELYDGQGKLVKDLFKSSSGLQEQSLNIDIAELQIAPGVYYVKTSINSYSETQKLVYIR